MEKSFSKKNKTICIDFHSKNFYEKCIDDPNEFRSFLIETHGQFPELFPDDFSKGFIFHDMVTSIKQDGFKMRRIMLKNQSHEVYQIRSSFMMPYMTAETAEAEKRFTFGGGASLLTLSPMFSGGMPCSGSVPMFHWVVIP